MLRHVLQTSALKVGCIVNDVAAVNIDAKLIRGAAAAHRGEDGAEGARPTATTADLADTIELANGCACCRCGSAGSVGVRCWDCRGSGTGGQGRG